MPDKSKELVVMQSSDIEALNELDAILKGAKPVENYETIDDPDTAQRRIIEQILAADDDDAMEAIGRATPWQELLGVPVEIYSFRWRPSEYDQGSPVYLIVDAMNMMTGDHVVLTTGSNGVIAQLSNMARRNRFPAIRILEKPEKTTKGGFQPLRLVSTPDEIRRRADEKMRDRLAHGDN